MSEQQPSSGQFQSITHEESQLKLQQSLEQLHMSIILLISSLYESNSLNDIRIADSVNQILRDFLKIKDISMIDIFAIFNSFRKNSMIYSHLMKSSLNLVSQQQLL